MASHTGSLEQKRGSFPKALRNLWEFVKKHRDTILLITSIILVVLAAILVWLISTYVFTHEFGCTHLIDETLGTTKDPICDGVLFQIKAREINLRIVPTFTVGPFPKEAITILPDLRDPIFHLLEPVRKVVVWTVLILIAVISLPLAFFAGKMIQFIKSLATSAGRRELLTNLNLWLLVFAVGCALFYFASIVPSFGK